MGDAANDMLQSIEQDAIAHSTEYAFCMDEDDQQLKEALSVASVTAHSLWEEYARQSNLEHKHENAKSPVSILQSSF